jgi:hypothetical protein
VNHRKWVQEGLYYLLEYSTTKFKIKFAVEWSLVAAGLSCAYSLWHLGVSFFEGGAVGGVLYGILMCEWDTLFAPQKDTRDAYSLDDTHLIFKNHLGAPSAVSRYLYLWFWQTVVGLKSADCRNIYRLLKANISLLSFALLLDI